MRPNILSKSSFVAVPLLLLLTLGAGSAHAEYSYYRSDRTGFFFRLGAGLGYGHYLYLDGPQYPRNAGGFTTDFGFQIGVRFGGGFVLAGEASFDPIWAISGHDARGNPRSAALAPGGMFGFTLGVSTRWVTLLLTLGAGGGGAYSVAGGVGFMSNIYLGFTVYQRRHLHVQIHLRPMLGILYDDPSNGDVAWVSGTIGTSLVWQ